MRDVLKILISTFLIASLIFTTGIDIIEENSSPEAEKEEVVETKEVPEKEEVEEVVNEDRKEKVEETTPEKPEMETPKEEIKEEVKEDVKKEVKIQEDPINKTEEIVIDKDDEKTNEEPVEENPEEPLNIILTDAEILIEEYIKLGSGKNSKGQNYMSDPMGGSGEYTYEWRILGEDKEFSKEKYPTVNPDEDTDYELTLKDSNGNKFIAKMSVKVLDPKGTIKITNIVANSNKEEFDIFIDGPNGSLYTVSLKNGESITLNNLERGNYKVSTIVPMNYKLTDITNKNIEISIDSLNKETLLNHTRINSSWFYSQ